MARPTINRPVVQKPVKPQKPQKPQKPLKPLRPLPVDEPFEDEVFGDHEGTEEEVAAAQLDDVSRAFREARENEKKRYADEHNADYYIVLVFQDGQQCSAFLKEANYRNEGNVFIDGRVLAQGLGIELPEGEAKHLKSTKKISKRLMPLADKPK